MKTANTRWEYTGTNSRRDWQIVKCWKLFVLLYANARGIVSLYLGIVYHVSHSHSRWLSFGWPVSRFYSIFFLISVLFF